MRTNYYLLSFLLAAGLGAPLASQAQATTEPAAPTDAPDFKPLTLLKLGTGATRGLTVGGFMGTAVPVALGVERQFAPSWSAYGNVSSGWRIGARTAAPDGHTRISAYLTELGADLGVRRYYHQAKRQAEGRQAGPFVGNYVAAQVSTSFTPNYAPKLFYRYTALSLVWGTQHRIGGRGLVDAHIGGGVATRLPGQDYQNKDLWLHLEASLKFSLLLLKGY